MNFEQAQTRLQEIKSLLESWEELTLTKIQELQEEAKECYEMCQMLLKNI
jgi:hypothetical protein